MKIYLVTHSPLADAGGQDQPQISPARAEGEKMDYCLIGKEYILVGDQFSLQEQIDRRADLLGRRRCYAQYYFQAARLIAAAAANGVRISVSVSLLEEGDVLEGL